jgi:hypothetical protein
LFHRHPTKKQERKDTPSIAAMPVLIPSTTAEMITPKLAIFDADSLRAAVVQEKASRCAGECLKQLRKEQREWEEDTIPQEGT